MFANPVEGDYTPGETQSRYETIIERNMAIATIIQRQEYHPYLVSMLCLNRLNELPFCVEF